MASTTERIDGFDGDESQYLAYLEAEVNKLRQQSGSKRASENRESAVSDLVRSRCEPDEELRRLEPVEFHLYNPAAKRVKSALPTWKRHAEALVNRTPHAEQWWSALRSEGVYDVMCNGVAFTFLLGDESSPPVGKEAICEGIAVGDDLALLRHIAQYAKAAVQKRLTASVATRLANFQHLLVLSACVVVRSAASPSVPEEHILDIVKICLGGGSTDYCRRMLDTAIYVNRLIDLLNAHGWDGRAAELLLWWNRPPSYYYALSRSSGKSLEYLRVALTKPVFIAGMIRPHKWTPLFLPGLVLQVTREQFHIVKISDALGYKHAHLLTRSMPVVNPWRVFKPCV